MPLLNFLSGIISFPLKRPYFAHVCKENISIVVLDQGVSGFILSPSLPIKKCQECKLSFYLHKSPLLLILLSSWEFKN